MSENSMKDLEYDELRALYKDFLSHQNISKATIDTVNTDSFYLWRKGDKKIFWKIVTSSNFEEDAKSALSKYLPKSTTNVDLYISSYMSSLRKFRLFLTSDTNYNYLEGAQDSKPKQESAKRMRFSVVIPKPSNKQVQLYLTKWDSLENNKIQEEALDKLFLELCPNNSTIVDVLLKSSTLNDFYSTNIFSIYPVAKHIFRLNIDERLKDGDLSLVSDIQYVKIGEKEKNFYSFATKYCSHHNAADYPIYDSYVDEVLRYFRSIDNFSNFKNTDLKNYNKFKKILLDFQNFYKLNEFTIKQIDQYVWLLGKEYFPKSY